MTSANRSSDLWRWSAAALRDAIASKEISAVEVAQAHIDRSNSVNGHLNALVTTSHEEALKRALEIDNGDGGCLLSGVPVTIKDNVNQAGQINSDGVMAYANRVSFTDAAVVSSLRDSGAVLMGRTNVPPFSLRWCSENDVYGRTLNPWSPDHVPGGSSGGAAAAVAAGIVPISHGNDIGGSIRYPAGVCGVTGIRPTMGRVSNWSPPPDTNFTAYPSMALMGTDGPIARHVTDLRLALGVMSRPELRDHASMNAPYVDEAPLPKGSKIGVVLDVPGTPTSTENVRALEQAAAHLADAGYEIVEVDVPEISEAHDLWQLILLTDLTMDYPDLLDAADDQLRISLGHLAAHMEEVWGPSPDLVTYLRGYARRNELLSSIETRFADVPLMLTPLDAQTTPKHGADTGSYEDASVLLQNRWPMTFVPNLGLPAASAPISVLDGLPISVQIVSGRFRESWILDAAQALEDRVGLLSPIDPVLTRT